MDPQHSQFEVPFLSVRVVANADCVLCSGTTRRRGRDAKDTLSSERVYVRSNHGGQVCKVKPPTLGYASDSGHSYQFGFQVRVFENFQYRIHLCVPYTYVFHVETLDIHI